MESALRFLIDHFPNLLDINLTASIVIIFVICVRRFMRKAPKIFSHALWGIVLLRLLVPISIESPISFVPEQTEFSSMVEVNEVLPEISFETPKDRADNAWHQENTPSGEPLTQVGHVLSAQDYLTFIWLIGIAVMLLYSLVSHWKLRRKLKVVVPYRKRIFIADDIHSPFVMGIFNPAIYLPASLESWERTFIIAHERHHIRRGDHIFKALGFLALTIHWFNPLVWVAFFLASIDMEMSCDEAVIRKLGEDVRADYSATLLNLSTGHRLFAGTPLAFGEGDPAERIRNLANWKKPAFWVIIICIIICSVLAACLLTNPESPAHDTITLEYFNRTMAHIEFHYADDSKTYQINEEYSVEILKAGIWQEVTNLSGKSGNNEIYIVTAEDADHDAWSILEWEDVYGRLPDGSYRIRKEITKVYDNGDSETTPVYIQFTIGGTAEEYITYSLKDITPTGANLYEHEIVDDSVALISSEGLWLESLQNGQWAYMEPTEDMNSVLPQEKYYIHELIYPSSHTELDWSDLYGDLPDGTYRIAREITNTDPSVLRLCTVYEEFIVGEATSAGNTASNVWGVSIKPDRVSRTGATALFVYSGSIPGEEGAELTYGDFLSLDRLVDGNWVPCDELAGYNYYVGDSSYSVVDGYGMVHEWPDRFGELADGHYRLGKQVTLVRQDGSTESRMVYGEFSLPDSVRTGPIPLEDLPEKYGAEQAMIDGCVVMRDGDVSHNQEVWQAFLDTVNAGQQAYVRTAEYHYYPELSQVTQYVYDIHFDGNIYSVEGILNGERFRKEYQYLLTFLGKASNESHDYDSYIRYVLSNELYETWEKANGITMDGSIKSERLPQVVYTDLIYETNRPQLPANPAQAVLEFEGQQLVSTTDFDRLEKIWILFSEAEFLGYEPKTHSVGVGLNLILTSKNGETLIIELDPDSDICRINGEFVFYGAYDEPDYIEKLWYYLGIDRWPEEIYAVCPNAYSPQTTP